ncbi:unnamed protein product [Peronospora destructor]|uniref:GPI inositol-deacylase n=1 Tax=Peronospora destructor TaxID=86335 RepID=A0AAV0USV6_9STRA|nr:unnamed protein product [Peronospora destructor]
MRAELTRSFLWQGRRLLSRRLVSSRALKAARSSAPKRPRLLPSLPVAVGVAALALNMSLDTARQLRNTMHLGMLIVYESKMALSFEDAAALVTRWSSIVSHGGVQDELIECLLSCILRLQDDKQSRGTLRFLIDQDILSLLLQYIAWSKPTDPTKLQQLVQSLIKLLEAAAANGQVELQVSLVTLAQALGHFVQQKNDVVSYVDLLRLGNALVKEQELARRRLEEGTAASQAFAVYRSDLVDPDSSHVAESCATLVKLCSPEMPESIKRIGLWALSALVQVVNREESSAVQAQQLEAVLGPTFATMLLALPRDNGLDSQLQAATLVDCLLHVARRNPATATRETYELWMEQIRYWTGAEQNEDELKPTKQFWIRRKSGQLQQSEDEETKRQSQTLCLQLQLISSRCMRTLTASPQSRRYVCESPRTMSALFELSRQIYKKKQTIENTGDEDLARNLTNIQRHVSWAFRNICTGFQSGAIALNCLFDAFSTAPLLQSRRNLPMSRFFRESNDLTGLPIIGAEEYEASTEVGWIDILTAWSASPDRHVRENGITSLVYLAEQRQPCLVRLMSEEDEVIRNKQEHILQAWLTNMLQQIRLLSGGELLAVKQMEEIANISKELTPGNERILFNPTVVDAGTSALAVLAEHHHAELVQQGVVPLVALLASTSDATPALHTQCARVLANLVATYCLDINPQSSALSIDPARVDVISDHVDIAKLLEKTPSGKQFFRSICRWRECDDPMQRSSYFRVVQNLHAYNEVVSTGRLVEDVYCEGVHPIISQSDVDSVGQLTDENGVAPLVDVVFVHGLRGHPYGTWRTNMRKPGGNNEIWPDVLLAKDLQRNNVPARSVTLGYEAGMVSWSSPWPSLTLKERARVMLSALYAANIGRDRRHPGAPARPVVFITHSMGGLLTKTMLLLEREQRDQCGLVNSTKGIIFLAVPHFGSGLAMGVQSESIRKLIQTHPAIEDLGADPNGRLKDLNDSFKTLGIDCFSVGEENASPVALGLSAVVVKPDSADPGIGRFYVLPESDHMTICKINSRNEPLYQEILQFVVQHTTANDVTRSR